MWGGEDKQKEVLMRKPFHASYGKIKLICFSRATFDLIFNHLKTFQPKPINSFHRVKVQTSVVNVALLEANMMWALKLDNMKIS